MGNQIWEVATTPCAGWWSTEQVAALVVTAFCLGVLAVGLLLWVDYEIIQWKIARRERRVVRMNKDATRPDR